ncbi:MAG: SDR family oxidoreductase [Pseudomonadota bacterium]
MARRLVLITGASSGIGAALARVFAAKGWDLALVARREDRLRDLAEEMKAKNGIDSLVIAADLADPGAPEAIVKAVADAGRQIDGLVNNAGAGQPGFYAETEWDMQARFLTLMVTNYARLAHLVLPGMMERGFGRMINVSSVSALLPTANAHTRYSGSLYPGAKSFLIKMSEALMLEAEGRNVHVTALCPGYTYSEFHDVNGARETLHALPKFWMLTAEEVAVAGYDAAERGVVCRVPGAWYKFMVAVAKVLPDPVSRALMRGQEKRLAAKAGLETGSANA